MRRRVAFNAHVLLRTVSSNFMRARGELGRAHEVLVAVNRRKVCKEVGKEVGSKQTYWLGSRHHGRGGGSGGVARHWQHHSLSDDQSFSWPSM